MASSKNFWNPKFYLSSNSNLLEMPVISRLTIISLCLFLPAQAVWAFLKKAPVSLDVRNANPSEHELLRPYMISMRQHIQVHWRPFGNFRAFTGKIQFIATPDGQFNAVRVKESSSSPEFDQCILSAVATSSPYVPVPVNHPLLIVATFKGKDYEGMVYNTPQMQQQTAFRPQTSGYPPPVYHQYASRTREIQAPALQQSSPYQREVPIFRTPQQQMYGQQQGYSQQPRVQTWNSQEQPDEPRAEQPTFFASRTRETASRREPEKSPEVMYESDEDVAKDFRFISSDKLFVMSTKEKAEYQERLKRWDALPIALKLGL